MPPRLPDSRRPTGVGIGRIYCCGHAFVYRPRPAHLGAIPGGVSRHFGNRSQRMHLERLQPLAASEEREVDDEACPHDHPAELFFDEAADRLHRAAGREDVVVDQHLRPRGDEVRVELEGVLAVLERIGGAHGRRGQLPGSPGRHEPAPGRDRDRRAQDEPACLSAEHEIGSLPPHPRRELGNRLLQSRGVGEERRDVLEADAGRRKIRYLADLRSQVDRAHPRATSRRSRQKSSVESSPGRALLAEPLWRSPPRRRLDARRCKGDCAAPGAISCSSSAVSRSVAVRNVRRFRGATP